MPLSFALSRSFRFALLVLRSLESLSPALLAHPAFHSAVKSALASSEHKKLLASVKGDAETWEVVEPLLK
jgi:hypothetical protein